MSNLQIRFGRTDLATVLSLPARGHGTSFHLFRSVESLINFVVFLTRVLYTFCTDLDLTISFLVLTVCGFNLPKSSSSRVCERVCASSAEKRLCLLPSYSLGLFFQYRLTQAPFAPGTCAVKLLTLWLSRSSSQQCLLLLRKSNLLISSFRALYSCYR